MDANATQPVLELAGIAAVVLVDALFGALMLGIIQTLISFDGSPSSL